MLNKKMIIVFLIVILIVVLFIVNLMKTNNLKEIIEEKNKYAYNNPIVPEGFKKLKQSQQVGK